MKKAFALIYLLAGPAAAQSAPPTGPQSFSLPAGCTAYLTVQIESCLVQHSFTCEGDPVGNQRRVVLDEQGMTYLGEIDAEAQWIESFHVLNNHRERLEADPVERASLTALFETGVDDYDFQTLSEEIGATRHVGQDQLTGTQVTIDGVTLEETTFEITTMDSSGNEIWVAKGREFVSRDWRMFLSGVTTVTAGGETYELSKRPVEFIFPGEPGFLSARPKHGCGLALS